MKEVIYIKSTVLKNEEPIQLTHRKTRGWRNLSLEEANKYLRTAEKIVYLGKCAEDGDMFAVYNGYIMIFKGRLNSGKY